MARWFALALLVGLGCSFSTLGPGSMDDGGETGSGSAGQDAPASAGPDSPDASAGGTSSATTGVVTSSSGTSTEGPNTGLSTSSSGPGSPTTSGRGESSSSGDATAGDFGCADVLFVAASDVIGGHDQPFYDVLVGLGASVTVVQDDQSTASDADGRCLIVVSASVTGSEVAGKFRDVAVPLVTWEYAIYDDMDMTGDAIGADFGPAEAQEDIEIVDPGHPMAAGLSGTFAVLAPAPGRMSWGMPGADADVVATLPGSVRATLFGYEAGDTMVGLEAPAARVGFPALTGDGTTINADGRALFEAALLWAVE